jgi:hypothetical protein
MRCINTDCNEELESGAEFCPFCGTDQPVTTQTRASTAATQSASTVQASSRPGPLANANVLGSQILEMRAGEGVWHFAEPERYVAPGERRPFVIRDEQVVHLAHSDRELKPEELLERVNSILAAQSVPVDVHLVRARWMNDSRETRPRLVAQLRNHPYSDIKMIMGVDYMGKWASIQLHLASELDPLPRPPEPPKTETNPAPLIVAAFGAFFLLLAFVAGASGSRDAAGPALLFGFLGFCGLIAGVIWFVVNLNAQATKAIHQRTQWQRDQERHSFEKAAERLVRTFKVDDMQLFCTAMRAVFQAVVDDIVQQGGEVVRVEGGKGGFFEGQSAEPAPAPRRADAALAGV